MTSLLYESATRDLYDLSEIQIVTNKPAYYELYIRSNDATYVELNNKTKILQGYCELLVVGVFSNRIL